MKTNMCVVWTVALLLATASVMANDDNDVTSGYQLKTGHSVINGHSNYDNCKRLLDLIVVVDGSDSINAKNFDMLRNVLVDMLYKHGLVLGENEARIGLVVYSTDIASKIDLTGNLKALKFKVSRLPHPRDGTNTALGIATMRDMFLTHGRANAPWVGVVITDGISKDPLVTTRQAGLAHAQGINMYAVGVGNLIDMTELLTIASRERQVLEVANFNELGLAMGSLMTLVCPTTPTSTTTPTTTPTPTTTTTRRTTTRPSITAPPNDACNNCRIINGVGYAKHPTDCHQYVQCYFDGENENGPITAVHRVCSFGQYWDQEVLTCRPAKDVYCSEEKCNDASLVSYSYNNFVNGRAYWECQQGHSVAVCCSQGYHYDPYVGCVVHPSYAYTEQCPPKEKKAICDRRPVYYNSAVYEQLVPGRGWQQMPCADGSLYNVYDCECSLLGGLVNGQLCKPELYLPFDTDTSDHSGNNVYVRNENVSVEHGAAFFDGTNRLLIPRFANVQIYDDLVIKLRYREDKSRTGSNRRLQALVSNGDCGEKASIVMASNHYNVHFGAKTHTGQMNTVTVPVTSPDWNEVVYIYSRGKLEGRVNGYVKHTQSTGVIERTHCALQVGHGFGFNNFKGYMDSVTVYFCKPAYV